MGDQLINNILLISGVLGFGLYVLMYYFLTIGKVRHNSLVFFSVNFIGSCCTLIYLMFNWNLFLIIYQCLWMLISIYGIIKSLAR